MDLSESKTKVLRCSHAECRKKLGLLGFECRCKKQFCAAHRAAEEHACDYDFKSNGKKELLKYMSSPVQAAKVAII